MGTQRVQMKGVLPLVGCFALLAGTSEFCPVLAVVVGPVQIIFFFIESIVLKDCLVAHAASPVANGSRGTPCYCAGCPPSSTSCSCRPL